MPGRSEVPYCCGMGCGASGQQGGVGCGAPPPSPAGRLAAGLGSSRSPHPFSGVAGGAHTLSLISPVKCPYLPSRPLCPSDPGLCTAPSRVSCPLSPSFLPAGPCPPRTSWAWPAEAQRCWEGQCCGHLASWDLMCCPCPAVWVGVLVPLHHTPSGVDLLTPCHLCPRVGLSLPATQQWGPDGGVLRETSTQAPGLPGLAGASRTPGRGGREGTGDGRPGAWLPSGTGASLQVPLVSEGGDSSPNLQGCGVRKGAPHRAPRPGPQAGAPGVQPRPGPRAAAALSRAHRHARRLPLLGPAPVSDGPCQARAALASGFWSQNSCSDS